MRVHVNKQTRQILGYYPEWLDYGDNLPPESDMEFITDAQHRTLIELNAWGVMGNGTPIATDPNPPPPPPAPAPLTVEERLAQAGLTVAELKEALGL